MVRCGCCTIVGISLSIALAVFLYPLSRWDRDVPLRTRAFALLLDQVLPQPSFNLCSLVGLIRGRSQIQSSRDIIGGVGSLAVLDSVKTEDSQVAGVPVRLYRPAAVDRHEALPVMVYFHGGGFVTGSIDSVHPTLMTFCKESRLAVLSVEYRLAPEHPYPAAFEDCLAVTKEVLGSKDVAELLAIDAKSVSVGGDSAGGGLSAAVSLHLAGTSLPRLRSQFSIYPTLYSVYVDRDGLAAYSAPQGLAPQQLFHMTSTYLGGTNAPADLAMDFEARSPKILPPNLWEAGLLRATGSSDVMLDAPSATDYPFAAALLNETFAPLLAESLKGTPPTIIVLAGIDPLVEEGRMYARRLRKDGVEAELIVYDKQVHAFINSVPIELEVFGRRLPYPGCDESVDAIQRAAKFVVDHSQ